MLWGVGRMVREWRRVAAVGVICLGVFFGTLYTGCNGQPSAQGQGQVTEQELFRAVQRYLEGKVPPIDLPKSVISYQEIGPRRYRVQMQMTEGVGWFEVWWDGDRWQAKGIPAPAS